MTLARLLPLAVVMIGGPQILTSFFLIFTPTWRADSAAYITGAAISTSAWVTIGLLLGSTVSDQGSSSNTVSIIVLVLLVIAGIHTFVKRKTSKPPEWMAKLEAIHPKASFRLGILLFAVFPGDIVTALGVGTYIAGHGEPWWNAIPFVLLTLLLLATPVLALLLFGKRAEKFLPKVSDWMQNNSWVVSEIVVAFGIVMIASGLDG